MKINVYEKRKIVKTYEVDAYDLPFGILEDVADTIDIDSLKTGSDVEIITLVGKMIIKNKNIIKELLKDIFDGITDEELRKTTVTEMVRVIVDIVTYTIGQFNLGNNSKN